MARGRSKAWISATQQIPSAEHLHRMSTLPAVISQGFVTASPDGEPANREDLLIAYALGTPYAGQHGDDCARWQARFGDLTVTPEDSLGMKPAPRASRQAELDWAVALCDRVLAAAEHDGLR